MFVAAVFPLWWAHTSRCLWYGNTPATHQVACGIAPSALGVLATDLARVANVALQRLCFLADRLRPHVACGTLDGRALEAVRAHAPPAHGDLLRRCAVAGSGAVVSCPPQSLVPILADLMPCSGMQYSEVKCNEMQ